MIEEHAQPVPDELLDTADEAVDPYAIEAVVVDVVEVEIVDLVDDDGTELVLVEEVETELVLPVWEPTGEPRVDEALDLLVDLDPQSVDGHVAVFEEVHRRLHGALADTDPAP
jgi:hypothetical protein